MRSSSFLGAMICAPFVAVCLRAQVPTGTLSGIARDPGGASVPGASVQATDIARGTIRQTNANTDAVISGIDLTQSMLQGQITSRPFRTLR
jgi:hypothetical protein